MKFYSINDKSVVADSKEALLSGLAPDGGLFYPCTIPTFDSRELTDLHGNSLPEVGYKVLLKWFGDELPDDKIEFIAKNALSFPIVMKDVGAFKILELFHGPTMAFKDVAARNLALLMSNVLENKQATILVATSGDTGGAVAHGFANVENIKVVVLYPKGMVSQLQEEQLTRVPDNVISFEVDGVFDDCQATVKKAFMDPELSRLRLTSANSISIGRLIPQIIYYIYSYAQFPHDNIEFVVPCGNFGSFTAGLLAMKMGLPFRKFIAATNSNDTVVDYYHTGEFRAKKTIKTLSTAMNIGDPSNFIRVLELFNHDYKQFRQVVKAAKVDDTQTIATIRKVYNEQKYLLDAHTAVAWCVAEKMGDKDYKQVILSTASPIKFAQELTSLTGILIDDSQQLEKLQKLIKKKFALGNSYQDFKKALREKL